MTPAQLSRKLADEVLILDGAMATQLEALGVDTDNLLWSAQALLNKSASIRQVHEAYFRAGADMVLTNTYQANIPAFRLQGYSRQQAEQMIRQAVILAREARDVLHPQGLVAGSIGPYGAYLANGSEYSGAYELDKAAFQDFHRPRIAQIIAAGADLLAIETMPHFGEIQALTELLAKEFPDTAAYASLSIHQDPAHLCDGTPLETVGHHLDQASNIAALGLNCTAVANITPALQRLRSVTDKPFVVYPNSGEKYDPETKSWQTIPGAMKPADAAGKWQELGARLIGGCCRTTPKDIRAVAESVTGNQ